MSTYQQYPQQQPYGGAPQYALPPYASWMSRVGAYLLDSFVVSLPGLVFIVIGAIVGFAGAETTTDEFGTTTTTGISAAGIAIMGVGYLLIFAIAIWNLIVRQGKTGQSLGKKWLGISVVKEATGQPLGVGGALVRYLMLAILGGICFLDYLWPLFDERKRAWHDMVVSSIVIRVK